MKRIEIRQNSSGRSEVYVDDTNPGGRSSFVNGIDPATDNVNRTIAMIRGIAAHLGVQVVFK